jgi:alpha-aminoadipic semialdehyde synthase
VPELLTTPVPHTYEAGKTMPRTHFMFSHTIKGQEYNMPLLSRFLDGSPASPGQDPKLLPRLVDYELLCGPDGRRTVGFGWFAGGKTVQFLFNGLACTHCIALG